MSRDQVRASDLHATRRTTEVRPPTTLAEKSTINSAPACPESNRDRPARHI